MVLQELSGVPEMHTRISCAGLCQTLLQADSHRVDHVLVLLYPILYQASQMINMSLPCQPLAGCCQPSAAALFLAVGERGVVMMV